MSRDGRYLSRILRHAPQEIGVTLDAHGWLPVDDLLTALKRAGRPISRVDLANLVAADAKQRFTVSDNGSRIRAAQGHSVPVDLDLAPAQPPEFLYHGTSRRSLDAIFADGLVPGRRQLVHLSDDHETAEKVGGRHGKPVVLCVAAGRMHFAGHVFVRSDNGVWLTEHVPAIHLSFGSVG